MYKRQEYNYLKNGLINTRFEDRYTTFTENFYAEYQALQNLRLTARFGLTKKNSGSEDYYPAGHTNFVSYTGDNLYKRGSYCLLYTSPGWYSGCPKNRSFGWIMVPCGANLKRWGEK